MTSPVLIATGESIKPLVLICQYKLKPIVLFILIGDKKPAVAGWYVFYGNYILESR
jgi:hypothetical protein